ncbi:MAG: hypothetical protein NZ870_02135, partial [bacterium]|nr:hypothetical protein [bacterium]
KMDELREKKKLELKKIKEEIDTEISKYKNKKQEILQEIETKKKELEMLKNEKENTIKQIPEDIKELYEKIISRTKDVAVSKVENSVCSVCNASISPDTTAKLSTYNAEDILSCYSCGRILILI